MREWQKIFAIVFQDYSLLSLTLGQNVAASEQYEAERAKKVLQLAGFGERLNKLKKGLETVVYPEYEQDGVSFSGGEEQKIAIARAIIRAVRFAFWMSRLRRLILFQKAGFMRALMRSSRVKLRFTFPIGFPAASSVTGFLFWITGK